MTRQVTVLMCHCTNATHDRTGGCTNVPLH